LGNVSKLPVLDVISGTHFIADVTLGLGEVVHDYLTKDQDYLTKDQAAPVQSPSLEAESVR
jgi:acetoacetate decarboxylase